MVTYEQDNNDIKKLPMDEKLKLLSEEDKDYLRGYIDRALLSVLSQEETS